jgi:hypothetical protein
MLRHLLVLTALPLSASLAPAVAAKLPPPAARTVDFVRDVQPIIQRACLSCHGAQKQRGGLRLDDGEHALKGGNSGAVLKPGHSAGSRLVQLVAGIDPDMKMPPGKGKELSAAEVGLIRAWIDQGAVWPKGNSAATSTGKSSHWAFQPIRRPALPTVRDPRWARNGIDLFILARLEQEKIAPAPEADRVTLLRRVTLDLIGLPPTPEEVDAFVHDSRPDAYERVVERLLASPHYGERWGRHWLDQARYADSDGFEKDNARPFAWRYRHYLIAALNRNDPYDRFIVEQLAGDLLPRATVEQKAATGFHRNTLTNREGGVDSEQFRVEAVVDRVNTTARVFLGLTLGCAQCHDHKYDPLSQREYYQFFAFFNSDVEVNIPATVIGEQHSDDSLPAARKKLLQTLLAREALYREKTLPVKVALLESLNSGQRRSLPQAVRKALIFDPADRTPAHKKVLEDYVISRDTAYLQLSKSIAGLRKTTSAVVQAQTMALGKPRRTTVLIRGDFMRPGVAVGPATPAVLPPLQAPQPTRLDLARWIASRDNPLTPRVAVNWVWSKYFGRGIVPTPEDFGTQGERPSHPELLDFLADELRSGGATDPAERAGWDLKALHRLIVTSASYRQSSAVRPELLARDPYNALLARQARLRLEAEVVRDLMLSAGGLLVKRVGGPSVRPPQPPGISELTYASNIRWVESTGPDRYRRGLYTWFQRTSPYPMLMTFDAPDSNLCCVKRERSNTPLQALTLLNDAVCVECAQHLGRRALVECTGDLDNRLCYAFRLCVARTPTTSELARLRQLHDELYVLCLDDEPAARKLLGADGAPAGHSVAEAATWMALGRVLLNLDEVVTRE